MANSKDDSEVMSKEKAEKIVKENEKLLDSLKPALLILEECEGDIYDQYSTFKNYEIDLSMWLGNKKDKALEQKDNISGSLYSYYSDLSTSVEKIKKDISVAKKTIEIAEEYIKKQTPTISSSK